MKAKKKTPPQHPERVLQFGEGNFLRGFVDWMLHRMNEKGLFQGQAVVIQPIASGLSETLNEQNGMYTLLLRGVQDGKLVEEAELIGSIRRAINPYTDYKAFLHNAANPDLRFIVSNTTEAGIAYDARDQYHDTPPATFPAKLTVFLHKRFKTFHGDPGRAFIVLPCELIERNGEQLRDAVLRYARQWGLGDEFIAWLGHNRFLNTLVDRIVTGYPKDEIAALTGRYGYVDHLFNTAEPFHLWVIEGDPALEHELPLVAAGLNVVWTRDMTPYRTRKVRILNGAHTMTALAAYLCGKETVKAWMDDPALFAFMSKGLFEEIIPSMDLPRAELNTYAAAVLERFANPFIQHYALSIALNSVSKFTTRVLPSIRDYYRLTGKLPPALCCSLAALLLFYRGTQWRDGALYGERALPAAGESRTTNREAPASEQVAYAIVDDEAHLRQFYALWQRCDGSAQGIDALVGDALAHEPFWGERLDACPGLRAHIAAQLGVMLQDGVAEAIRRVVLDDNDSERSQNDETRRLPSSH